MKCKHIRNMLIGYSENDLSPEKTGMVEEHLNSCAGCREYYKVLSGSLENIHEEVHVEYDPFMLTRVMSVLQQPEPKDEETVRFNLLQPVVVTIVILIMVFAGISIGRNFNQQYALASDYKDEIFYLNEVYSDNLESIIFTDSEQN